MSLCHDSVDSHRVSARKVLIERVAMGAKRSWWSARLARNVFRAASVLQSARALREGSPAMGAMRQPRRSGTAVARRVCLRRRARKRNEEEEERVARWRERAAAAPRNHAGKSHGRQASPLALMAGGPLERHEQRSETIAIRTELPRSRTHPHPPLGVLGAPLDRAPALTRTYEIARRPDQNQRDRTPAPIRAQAMAPAARSRAQRASATSVGAIRAACYALDDDTGARTPDDAVRDRSACCHGAHLARVRGRRSGPRIGNDCPGRRRRR